MVGLKVRLGLEGLEDGVMAIQRPRLLLLLGGGDWLDTA